MKLEVLEGECKTSGEELRNKVEAMKTVNTELSSFKERVMSLTKENEVLEVKVLKRRHLYNWSSCYNFQKFQPISTL